MTTLTLASYSYTRGISYRLMDVDAIRYYSVQLNRPKTQLNEIYWRKYWFDRLISWSYQYFCWSGMAQPAPTVMAPHSLCMCVCVCETIGYPAKQAQVLKCSHPAIIPLYYICPFCLLYFLYQLYITNF